MNNHAFAIGAARSIRIAGLCCLLLWAAPSPGAAEGVELVPGSWVPSLSQAARSVEESLEREGGVSQQFANQASQNLADIRDAELFIVYVRLVRLLDSRNRTALAREQKTWLRQREVEARKAVVSAGGSLAALEYSDAFRQITERRLAELKVRLEQGSKSPQPSQREGR